MRSEKTLLKLLCLMLCVGFSPSVLANNSTMAVLVAGAQLKITTASGGSFRVNFNANGTYTASTGSSGSWTIDNETLCTLRAGQREPSCGTLPPGKTMGDSWQTTYANRVTVTASIVAPE